MSERSKQTDPSVTDKTSAEDNSFAKPALILGIIGLVLSFIPFINFVSWILGLLSIIFGIAGFKQHQKKGIATAGLILGLITIAWKIADAVFFVTKFISF